ncbi:uncharacterized protein VTP21DRAFT_9711 [Calcarisporiella thermophila]|uniref:uncharacterized protein n=1 Tax=Calcarisporiella thermophila TaxID=911321 RepID=UPI00374372B1
MNRALTVSISNALNILTALRYEVTQLVVESRRLCPLLLGQHFWASKGTLVVTALAAMKMIEGGDLLSYRLCDKLSASHLNPCAFKGGWNTAHMRLPEVRSAIAKMHFEFTRTIDRHLIQTA